jgi:Fe2+ transport system protein FeoA
MGIVLAGRISYLDSMKTVQFPIAEMTDADIRPLSEAPLGAECMIREICASPETRQRLREIGFSENIVVRTVVRNTSQLICELHATRIGLHRRVAETILIGLL